MRHEPVPMSLITGFLGSGKTTLLNALLKDPRLKNTAIIVNEFGDVGIDHFLVESADEDIIELSDGCLCCTVRGDLVDTLTKLLQQRLDNRGTAIERIIVETTGLADPAPILHAVMAHPILIEKIRLDGIITLVDAVNGDETLNTHKEAVKQAAMADRIVISKTDLVLANEALQQLTRRLFALNPSATVIMVYDVDISNLFDCGLYNPANKTLDVSRWLREEAVPKATHNHHDTNRHDNAIRAFTLIHDRPIEADALQMFFDLLRSTHGPQLLRVKGIIQMAENPDQPIVVHAVQQVFHPPVSLAAWPDDDHRTRLVVITRDLPEVFVQRLFDAFTGKIAPDTPDRMALEQNPLAIPGSNFRQ